MSKPTAVPARPGLSLTTMLASADDDAPSQPASPGPARCEVTWSQSRSRSWLVVRGVVEPADLLPSVPWMSRVRRFASDYLPARRHSPTAGGLPCMYAHERELRRPPDPPAVRAYARAAGPTAPAEHRRCRADWQPPYHESARPR